MPKAGFELSLWGLREVSIRLSVTAIVNWPAPARDRFLAMAPIPGHGTLLVS